LRDCFANNSASNSRFIINVPSEELASIERICFQIEQAHWFYEDFVREERPNFPSFSLKNFSALFFAHCPLLVQWAHDHEKAFQTFMEYKVRVPVCGAIMLNERLDKVRTNEIQLGMGSLFFDDLGSTRERMEVKLWMGLPERKDQQGRI
jgi:hypothetical protein